MTLKPISKARLHARVFFTWRFASNTAMSDRVGRYKDAVVSESMPSAHFFGPLYPNFCAALPQISKVPLKGPSDVE